MSCLNQKLTHLSLRQGGRTLIELMISITIGLVVVVAMLAIYTSTNSTGRQSEAGSRMSEDAGVAMNYMSNYIRMAGFSFPQANVASSVATLGSATVEVPDSNFAGAGIRGCDNGFSNISTATTTTALTCNASPTGFGGAIALRFEGDLFNTSPVGTSPNFFPSDCLNNGITSTIASEYIGSPAYTLVESRFFVSQAAVSGTPELSCAGNGGGTGVAFVGQPIMQFVESMAFTYGVANDVAESQVTRYLTAAEVDALGGSVDARWSRVVNVRVCLVMRSQTPDQNAGSSFIDCGGNSTASTGGFLRRTFSSIVTLRPRGGIAV